MKEIKLPITPRKRSDSQSELHTPRAELTQATLMSVPTHPRKRSLSNPTLHFWTPEAQKEPRVIIFIDLERQSLNSIFSFLEKLHLSNIYLLFDPTTFNLMEMHKISSVMRQFKENANLHVHGILSTTDSLFHIDEKILKAFYALTCGRNIRTSQSILKAPQFGQLSDFSQNKCEDLFSPGITFKTTRKNLTQSQEINGSLGETEKHSLCLKGFYARHALETLCGFEISCCKTPREFLIERLLSSDPTLKGRLFYLESETVPYTLIPLQPLKSSTAPDIAKKCVIC